MTEDLSRGHVNELMSRMVSIFRWGAAEGKIPAHVPQILAIIPGLRKGRTTLPKTAPVASVAPDAVDATLPYLSPIVAAMVRFQLLTGARLGEVCKLRPCDVDRSGEVWEAMLTEHKTAHYGKTRTIFIGPQAQEVLSPYLLRDTTTTASLPVNRSHGGASNGRRLDERRCRAEIGRRRTANGSQRESRAVVTKPVPTPSTLLALASKPASNMVGRTAREIIDDELRCVGLYQRAAQCEADFDLPSHPAFIALQRRVLARYLWGIRREGRKVPRTPNWGYKLANQLMLERDETEPLDQFDVDPETVARVTHGVPQTRRDLIPFRAKRR